MVYRTDRNKSKLNTEDIYTLDGLIKTMIELNLHNLHTSIPCVVESFNGDGTVNATPAIKRVLNENDEEITLPTLSEIPIIYPSVGKYRITFPIEKGDEGMLVFSEREINQFVEKGEITRPLMYRKHSISDAVFIPALISQGKRNNVSSSEGLVLEEVSGGAKIELINGKINLYGTIVMESIPGTGLTDITLNTHIHQGGGSGPPQVDGGGEPN